jgi:guanine deaminase
MILRARLQLFVFKMDRCAYKGNIVHSISLDVLEILEGGMVVVDSNGIVEKVFSAEQAKGHDWSKTRVIDFGHRFIAPGLIDTHAHAPQYAQLGTGTDLPLLEWLNKYTFPTESRFADVSFARQV